MQKPYRILGNISRPLLYDDLEYKTGKFNWNSRIRRPLVLDDLFYKTGFKMLNKKNATATIYRVRISNHHSIQIS